MVGRLCMSDSSVSASLGVLEQIAVAAPGGETVLCSSCNSVVDGCCTQQSLPGHFSPCQMHSVGVCTYLCEKNDSCAHPVIHENWEEPSPGMSNITAGAYEFGPHEPSTVEISSMWGEFNVQYRFQCVGHVVV